jgi:hypothetical protein
MPIVHLVQRSRFEPSFIVRLLRAFERIHVIADPWCIIEAAEIATDSWLDRQLPGIIGVPRLKP